MKPARCIVGRATTHWKAHRENPRTLFVLKESWPYLEHEDDGKLLREATGKGVVYIARYYHHETIRYGM
ncbi:hypothetical protein QBC36DRAFT_337387 [Triangularia setosa]|uniref:Fungal-type protein kinase domain-containing protein n=1 Tax=Triangularia setosa TaxID=2587417 RepID=A0AAN7A3G6_9PEZI|nr:hypothetical protein QBC36DRAFT_337387 [Podospora setosa]